MTPGADSPTQALDGRQGWQRLPDGAGRYLHERLAAELRRRIRAGDYRPESRIPSVSELVREFDVSAITARHAVRDLTLEGLLIGRPGAGVFVARDRRITRSLGGHSGYSLSEDMRRAGIDPGIRNVNLSLVCAPEEVASTLRLEAGSLVYKLDKTILADGEPVSLGKTYIPRALGDLLGPELSQGFVGPLLSAHRIAIDHIDFRFGGAAISEDQAPLLGLPIGFPLLAVHYTYISAEGTAIVMGQTLSRSDRVTYELCTRPEMHHPT